MNKYFMTDKPRYHLVDSMRGFALINMIAYHLIYDILVIFCLNSSWCFQPLTIVWERFICISFILISGIAFNFSDNGYKNGIVLNLLGFAITAVTALILPEQAVWFGILNFLGCAVILLQTGKPYIKKINPVFGLAVSVILFALTYGIPQKYIGIFTLKLLDLPDTMYSFKCLSFLGFKSADFHSSDYFPIIPWIFMFAVGYFVWRLIEILHVKQFFMLKIPVLNTMGRYSLWIYLLHQPLIMGILMIIMRK